MALLLFILTLVLPLIIVFWATPYSTAKFRCLRLLFAVFISWVFIALGANSLQSSRVEKYYECRGGKEDSVSSELMIKCKAPIADTYVFFYELFGWLPTLGYTGFWEIIWRIYHRKTIKSIGKEYKGNLFSYNFILISLAPLIYIFVLMIAVVLELNGYL